MRAEPSKFEGLDLRCHALLVDVPLHDVWAIPLTGGGPDRTMQDVLAVSPFLRSEGQNPAVRGLFALRRGLGRLFRWDREDPRTSWSFTASPTRTGPDPCPAPDKGGVFFFSPGGASA